MERSVPSYGVHYCSAVVCKKRYTKGISFFRYPRDRERSLIWIRNSGRLDLLDKPTEHVYRNHHLCARHFEMKSFLGYKMNKLVWNAVPTIFVKSPEGGLLGVSPMVSTATEQPALKETSAEISDVKPEIINEPILIVQDIDLQTILSVKTENEEVNYNRQGEYIIAGDNRMLNIDKTQITRKECSARNCFSEKEGNLEVTSFSFPQDAERSKVWARNCGRDDLIEKDALLLNKNHLLCSMHFEEDQFVGRGKKELISDAIPTIFYILKPPQYHLLFINEIVNDKLQNTDVGKESEQIAKLKITNVVGNVKDPVHDSDKEIIQPVTNHTAASTMITNQPSSSLSTASVISTSSEPTSNLLLRDADIRKKIMLKNKTSQTDALGKTRLKLGQFNSKADKMNHILNITKTFLSEELQEFLETEFKYPQKKCLCQKVDQLL